MGVVCGGGMVLGGYGRGGVTVPRSRSYVSGAVSALDLSTGRWKWHAALDLTTAAGSGGGGGRGGRGLLMGTPAVVDLEGDGAREVLVGTSMGLVCVRAHACGGSCACARMRAGARVRARACARGRAMERSAR